MGTEKLSPNAPRTVKRLHVPEVFLRNDDAEDSAVFDGVPVGDGSSLSGGVSDDADADCQ